MLLIDKKQIFKEITQLKNGELLTIFQKNNNEIVFKNINNSIKLDVIYNNGYSSDTPILSYDSLFEENVFLFNYPEMIPNYIKDVLYRKWFVSLIEILNKH